MTSSSWTIFPSIRAAARWPAAILDRHCARRLPGRRSGREDGRRSVEQEDDTSTRSRVTWGFWPLPETPKSTYRVEEANYLQVVKARWPDSRTGALEPWHKKW